MNASTEATRIAQRAARATPDSIRRRLRGLSDRTITWLFISPAIVLLLALNIFPLIWTVYLSFTNFKANRANRGAEWVGLDNYRSVLGDADIWHSMQVTAHFVIWSITIEVLLGFALALLIDKRFRGHSLWTTVILLPMMLSPAVVGTFWTFLFQPQSGLFL
jgi:multiple sugar transport system permease protein